MFGAVNQLLHASLAQAGWDRVVRSLEGAIQDRSHAIALGWVLGLALVTWANFRLVRWLLGREGPRR